MRLSHVLTGAIVLVAAEARAQDGGFALNHFEPAPAGDMFLGVPSPYASGHLEPRAYLMFDHAVRPIRLAGDEDVAAVSAQGFLRLDASLALWERLLVSVDAPLALVQEGDEGVTGITFNKLESPRFGDLRIGLRGRIVGEEAGPIQLGVGSYLWAPTGSEAQYTGDGSTRGGFHAVAGGRIGDGVGFAYTAAGGVELRSSDSPHAITYGAGAALLLGDELVQIDAQLFGVTPLGGDLALSTAPALSETAGTNLELLFGGKLRVLDGLTVGGGVGPGLLQEVGTPTFRAVGMIGWAPLADRAADATEVAVVVTDRDDDGVPDSDDACKDVPGQLSDDATLNGCPPPDKDGDGVLDVEDACPDIKGTRNLEVTKNGCPEDRDADGIVDAADACPTVAGSGNADPSKNGCPRDKDADGIVDGDDACPEEAGNAYPDDRKQHGCPEDRDGDGIGYGADACPDQRGPASNDPKENGCSRFISVTEDEIVLKQTIEFDSYGSSLKTAVSKNSEQLLLEVKDAILDPAVARVEVQGHTDDSGDDEFNLKLSRDRAEAVHRWLVDHGVPPEKISARGYGFEKPIADNRTRQGRAKNRRVQFVILERTKK